MNILRISMLVLIVVTAILGVARLGVLSTETEISEPESESVPLANAVQRPIVEPVFDDLSPRIASDEYVHRSLLDDPDPSVREDAVESLGDVGSADAIAGLGYAMSDENKLVRMLAIEELAESGNDDAIAMLALALNDEDPDIRELAVDALATVGTESAMLVLQRFLSDKDPRVRETAAEYLSY